MHSLAQMNGQFQQTGPPQQAPQAATRAWSANNSHQYMSAYSGVQPSQSANFNSQSGGYACRQMAANHLLKLLLTEPEKFSLNLQSQNSSPPASCGSQAPTQQSSYQYSTNQILPKTASPNTTSPQQDVIVPWTQAAAVNERQTVKALDVSQVQQHKASQNLQEIPNSVTMRPLSSYTTAAPSLPQQQMVNPNLSVSAATQNVHINNKQFRQNSAEGRFPSVYQSSCSMTTSEPFGSGSATQSFSNGQVLYVPNIPSQKTQQPTTYLYSSFKWKEPAKSKSTNMMNQYNSTPLLVRTNAVPLNPAGGSQQMVKRHVSADSLCNVYTVSSDQYPPPYESHYFVSNPRISNQNVQPMTSARSESYNLNATQPLSHHSGQFLPQSVMSRGQLTLNCPPQQNTSPTAFSINSAEGRNKRKKEVTVPLPDNSLISKECPVGLSLSSTVKQNDNSFHPTPGHTNTRAIAVVPPLSQENKHTSSDTATDESVNNAEKEHITPDLSNDTEAACLRDESDLNQVNPYPKGAKKATTNGGAVLTTSDSERPALKPSEVPVNQTSPGEQNEMGTPPSPPVLELSSLPTNAWTAEGLHELIFEMEKAQPKPQDDSGQSIIVKLLIMFWNKNPKALLQTFNNCKFDFAFAAENLCASIPEKSVLLSEVKPDFKEHLKQYHVLEDGEIYLEQPYKSLWLNVNHQLDDIDKEFGFPWALKQHLYVDETDSQIDPLKTDSSAPEQIVNEVQNKILSQTEPESIDLVEEKEESSVESSPSSPASLNEPGDASSDFDHSFKIEVLPPEEAKSIYEQIQNHTNQSTNCENVTALSNSLLTRMDKDADATLKTSNVENKSDKITEICCITRFIEMYSISDAPSSKCLCKEEQRYHGQTIKSPKPDFDNPAKSKEVKDCETITLSSSELCSKLDQIIDLTDEDDKLYPSSDQETDVISQLSDDIQLNIVSKSDNKDADFFTNDFGTSRSPFTLEISETESEDNCPQEELKSAESIPPDTSVSRAEQTESRNVLQLSDRRENCGQDQLKLAEEAESPLESKGQTHVTHHQSFSHHVREKPGKEKRKRESLDQFFPDLKNSKFKRPIEAQPLASEVKIVELQLFGSGQKRQDSLPENKRSPTLSSTNIFSVKNKPPELLSVSLDPSRRKSLEANCPEKYSAKQLIYERWRNTFPPTLNSSFVNGFRNKLKKRQKRRSASISCTSSKKHWSSSSEVQVPDGTNKHHLSPKKRKSLLRRREDGRRRYSVTFERPENWKEREAQNKNLDVTPLQENIVLKFSVLPKTFHFKDGSSRTKETPDSVSDMPELENDNQFPQKTAVRSKGTWCPTTTKQDQPLRAPQTVNLFHEYQKKYKEKTRLSTDDSSNM
ncbi:uncharacterized protein LOC108237491 isoform X1 [Kryptolebias marmoratus]|uniref:uncharacterized protein LOC108237491 isoform X1 n=1 Tax=Kryptolebias marmoratus TaxID=37003 RepID=UPI0007F8DADB|nr:uncharacterized protein LOC108237491 isoform X1 [Kryptolebias marmoratus]